MSATDGPARMTHRTTHPSASPIPGGLPMRRTALLAVSLALVSLSACSDQDGPVASARPASAALTTETDHDVSMSDVVLRPGVDVDLHARVFVNERHHGACGESGTVLAVS